MPDSTVKKYTLHNAYLSLPPKIKEWLNSDQIYFQIEEISNRLSLKEEKTGIIPTLILRLTVQDLEPVDFINELSQQMGIDFPTAKAIAEDIEKNIFRPMEGELRRDVGVDVKMIYFGKPSNKKAESKLQAAAQILSTTLPIEPTAAPAPTNRGEPHLAGPTEWERLRSKTSQPAQETQKERVVNLQSFEIKGEETKTTPPEPQINNIGTEKEELPATPFMLHEENPNTGAKVETSFKTPLNIKVRNYSDSDQFEKKSELSRTALKPISVKLETPELDREQETANEKPAADAGDSQVRIVHYSEFRTPIDGSSALKSDKQSDNSGNKQLINDFKSEKSEKNKNSINLLSNRYDRQTAPARFSLPAKPPEIIIKKNSSYNLPEENRVDLRKFAKPDESTVDLRKNQR